MPAPRVLVSSTCYDLGVLRAQVKRFLDEHGFVSVLSEFSDVLFDPDLHTHLSCIREAAACDMAILVIGSRFGGDAVPDAVAELGDDVKRSFEVDSEADERISVTQAEALKCIEREIPLFVFVEEGVLSDFLVYQRNKSKGLADQIDYPNIAQEGTAQYIFEFINMLDHRAYGNAIQTFSTAEEIETHLRLQWAALFQRLLSERRTRRSGDRRLDRLSEEVGELRTAFITSIQDQERRNLAKSVLQFRSLIEVVSALPLPDVRAVIEEAPQWEEVLDRAGIQKVRDADQEEAGPRGRRTILEMQDGSLYESRWGPSVWLSRIPADWNQFRNTLNENDRIVIYDTLMEDSRRPRMAALRRVTTEDVSEEDDDENF